MKISDNDKYITFCIMLEELEERLSRFPDQENLRNKRKDRLETPIRFLFGFCSLLYNVHPRHDGMISEYNDIENYPELMRYKSDDILTSQYWFPLNMEGWEKRRSILKTEIKKLEHKLFANTLRSKV